jgi:U3 small nucleolar RNA-associated protein 23
MIVITQCCVEALYKLGPEYQSSTNTAKTFERRRCNHREAIDPDECLKDVIGGTNKHNYVLAAQSASLRQKLQNVPGLPIIHFNPREVLVLSPPSIATTRQKNTLEEERRKEAEKGLGEVVDGANVIGGGGPSGSGSGSGSQLKEEKARARKKVNAPNPLSVRKKKVEKRPREETVEQPSVTEELEGEVDAGGKRRKKRKRGRGKGAVAEARAELAGMGEGEGGEGSGSGSGSDGESD